ncbi:MAG: permease-like cell division protein FtsX [Desulfobacterota bacterium]|nr:permease-like cell division protein FtsX [Thermodesulfobacteriota bacterium]
MGQLIYFIKKAFQNLGHFWLINLITTGIISLSLLMLSIFLMTFLNLERHISKWKEQIQMSVYLSDNNLPEENSRIQKKIGAFPQVKSISFISKEEALNFFKKNLPEQKLALENLKENPLPASIDIQIKEEYRTPEEIKKFASQLKKIPGVTGVEYGENWLEGYNNFLNLVKSAGSAVGIIILFATIFIISNTIKLTLFARKEEITIMRFVGATDLFIKIPFYLEGVLQGVIGAMLAILLLYVSYQLFIKWLSHSPYLALNSFTIVFLPFSYIALVISGGIVTGLLGSFFSLGRYFKDE